jgi:hypothetical protein
MSVRKVQLRRGTGAENNAFIGAVGEITVNTTNNSIRVHDGLTLGGSETAKANLANVLPTQNLNLNEYKIVNVSDPNDPQDVATKNYVDTHGGGGGASNLADLNDVNINLPTNGNILTYNNGTWENHVLTGDATLSATGTLILSAIDNAKLVNSTINIGASPIALGDTINLTGGLAITGNTLSVGNVDTATKLFTAVTLSLGGSVITGSVSFDGSQSVEIIADVTPESITNGMIADSTITNVKLEHDFIAFNSHEVHLGESVTINGTDGEISVDHNAGVYTIGLAGTIVATSAVALAKTINLAGNATGSVSLDNALASVTLNVTLGTITNMMLEHDYISINDFQLHLSDNLDVVGANGVTINLDENTSILTVGLGTISTDNLSSNFITFADSDTSENIALGGTLTFLGVANETSVFVLNGEVTVGLANDVEIQGNLTVNTDLSVVGDLYASNIIESSLNAGITLQDTTSINANLDVYNPTGALINGTTVYLYVKYGANSIANGEYFHIFKTNDNGSIRQVIPLTLLQDGGQNKLAIKPSGIYEYQAVAGAYTNAGNVPNASFVLDTEGGTYTYQIRAYTSNDDGTEFEVAFSLNDANPAPTYSILFTSNDGSAYNREYLISYDSSLNIQGNVGAISTFNQTEKALSVDSSTGNTIIKGNLQVQEITSLDANTLSLSLVDNLATSLDIKEGSNSYLKFDTTDTVEKIIVGKDLDVTTSHILLASSEGSRYACSSPSFVANVITLTAPTIYINKDAYFLDNSGTPGTVNLFELTNTDYNGYVLALFNVDNSATMTIDGFGTQTIGGSLTKDIPAGGCLTIMAKGTSWYIM